LISTVNGRAERFIVVLAVKRVRRARTSGLVEGKAVTLSMAGPRDVAQSDIPKCFLNNELTNGIRFFKEAYFECLV